MRASAVLYEQQQLNAEYAGAAALAAAPLSFGRETGRTVFLYIR